MDAELVSKLSSMKRIADKLENGDMCKHPLPRANGSKCCLYCQGGAFAMNQAIEIIDGRYDLVAKQLRKTRHEHH